MYRISISAIAAFCICFAALIQLYALIQGASESLSGAWIALCVGLFCLVALCIIFFKRALVAVPRSILLLTPLPFLCIACISFFGGPLTRFAFFGAGFEFGTLGCFVLLAFAVVLGALAERRGALGYIYCVTVLGLLSLCAFAWNVFSHIPFSELASQQIPLFLAAATIVIAVYADRAEGRIRFFCMLAALPLTVGVFLCGIPEIAAAAIGALVLVVASRYLFDSRASLPPPFATGLLGLLFLLAVFCMPLRPAIGFNQLVRPAFSDTFAVAGAEYVHSLWDALVGTGPASLSYAWNSYRSADLNQTVWWDNTPGTTYSDAASIGLLFGLLGLAAWCLFPLAVLTALTSVRRRTIDDIALFECAAALASFCFIAALFYPIGIALFFIGCAGLGICARSLSGTHATYYELEGKSRLALLCLCGIAAVVLLDAGINQLRAIRDHALGELLVTKDLSTAVAPLQKAAQEWPIPEYQLNAAQVTLNAAIALAQEQKTKGAVDTDSLQFSAKTATDLAEFAVRGDPRNTDTLLSRAALYALLYSAGFTNVSDRTQQLLLDTATSAPTRPDVSLDQAIFAKLLGDIPAARTYSQEALQLKPDYEDARVFLRALPLQ